MGSQSFSVDVGLGGSAMPGIWHCVNFSHFGVLPAPVTLTFDPCEKQAAVRTTVLCDAPFRFASTPAQP